MRLNILSTTTTNNFNDPQQEEKIMGLWRQNSQAIEAAFQQGKSVFCVYHSYQGNYRDDYAVSLCIESAEPAQFDTTTLQWQEYAVDPEDEYGIVNTWKQVWADEEADKLNRTYQFDYEQYNAKGQVTIQIGVKRK